MPKEYISWSNNFCIFGSFCMYIVTYTNNIHVYSNRDKVQNQKAEKLMIEDTGYVWEF